MRTSRWFRQSLTVAAALVFLGFNTRAAFPQSLGDVARREAERRQQVTSGRVYTNEDLAAVDPASTTPQPASPAAAPAQEPATTSTTSPGNTPGTVIEENAATGTTNIKTAPGRPKRDEQYWRARAKDLRERLAKVHADIAAAERRLAALDGAPDTPAAARERQLAAETLARLQSDANIRNQDMAQLRTLAEGAKIPLEWIGAN